jgi:hypothetical protein
MAGSIARGSASAVGETIPIGMIKSGAEIVNDVSRYQSRIIYDGFVLFGGNGAFAGFGIGFEHTAERSRFAKKFVLSFRHVFRGPINLEKCAGSAMATDPTKAPEFKPVVGNLLERAPKPHSK